jgi:hypothetical protein
MQRVLFGTVGGLCLGGLVAISSAQSQPPAGGAGFRESLRELSR